MYGRFQLRPWVCKKCIGRLTKELSTSTKFNRYTKPDSPEVLSSQPAAKDQRSPQDLPFIASRNFDTVIPSPSQLKHASKYFTRYPAQFLWSAPKFCTMDFGGAPEVAILGRSNVGKSSLLNALVGSKKAHTSSQRGRTTAMNAYSIGDPEGENKLVVLDMPGYGKGAKAEWGKEIIKYLEKRRQLKRAFVLVDSEHGFKPTDKQLLGYFLENEIPHQIVLSKVDKIILPSSNNPWWGVIEKKLEKLQEIMDGLEEELGEDHTDSTCFHGQLYACSAEKAWGGKKLGVEGVQFAILTAAGMELKEAVKTTAQEEIVPYDELIWKEG